VIDDPRWLREQITALTDRHESGRENRWHVSDAPSDYLGAQLKGIVGVRIVVKRMEGKWKASGRQVEGKWKASGRSARTGRPPTG
jgi:transcriptional regulator